MKVYPGSAMLQNTSGSAAAEPTERPRSDSPQASGDTGGAPHGRDQRVETRPVQESSGGDRPRPEGRGRQVDVRA